MILIENSIVDTFMKSRECRRGRLNSKLGEGGDGSDHALPFLSSLKHSISK